VHPLNWNATITSRTIRQDVLRRRGTQSNFRQRFT
jgi:hypothetical protein